MKKWILELLFTPVLSPDFQTLKPLSQNQLSLICYYWEWFLVHYSLCGNDGALDVVEYFANKLCH